MPERIDHKKHTAEINTWINCSESLYSGDHAPVPSPLTFVVLSRACGAFSKEFQELEAVIFVSGTSSIKSSLQFVGSDVANVYEKKKHS